MESVLDVARQAGKVAKDVRLVAENPMHLPGKTGGISSLATAVELLAAAVIGLIEATSGGDQ